MLDVSLEDYHKEVAIRMLNPPHPGQFIGTGIIAPLGLSVAAAAGVPGVSRPELSSLLNSKPACPAIGLFESRRRSA